ncbi:MAG: hypothetical protein VB118_06065 [Oscillospiraceae bacterium]|nr:hypothetical protein [Oscillospiraceae bacterium]
MSFNKKLFSIILDRARGDRSWRQFSLDSDISYVQMRKLAQMQQENPPRVKLIKKLAQNSLNDIAYDDLLFCAGVNFGNEKRLPVSSNSIKQGDLFYEQFLSLSIGQRKMICDFMDFLSNR